MGALVRGIFVAALLALVAAGPAAGAPSWSKPEPISPPGAIDVQTAMDASGRVLAVWTLRNGDGSYRTGYRWWLPGRGWTQVRNMPERRIGIAVGMSAHGEAQVAVHESADASAGPLSVATAAAGEELRGFERVTDAAAASTVGFGVDDVGNAIVAWIRPGSDSEAYVTTRRTGGDFATPLLLEDHVGISPVVAINPAGAAAVAWGSNIRGGAAVSYRPPGGSFGPTELAISEHTNPKDIGIDTRGRVVVTGDEAGLEPSAQTRARFAIRSALGGWSETRSIDAEGFVSVLLAEPRGTVTFLTTTPNESRAFTLMLDGELARETLSPQRVFPHAAMDLRGDILAVWDRLRDDGAHEMVARERAATAFAFGPELVLGAAQARAAPVAALNDLGQAAVAWIEGMPGSGTAFATVRDDPALRAIPAPPDVDLYSDPLATLDPDGDLLAPVRCSVSCKVRATGIVFPGGARAAVAGGGKSVRLKARKRKRVKLDFGVEGARAAREALAAGERPWVSVTVTGRGKSPRPLVVSRRYKLKG